METFEEFKNSFSYGGRSDMNFKFLKGLPAADAGQFFQELFRVLVETTDGEDPLQLAMLLAAWQERAYSAAEPGWVYDSGPFTPLGKPLSETRLATDRFQRAFYGGGGPGAVRGGRA